MLGRQILAIGLVLLFFCVELLPGLETETLYLSGKGKDDPVRNRYRDGNIELNTTPHYVEIRNSKLSIGSP